MMGDLVASFCALAELLSRVTARIVKSEGWARRASITAPPCLPVAPVTRITFVIVWVA